MTLPLAAATPFMSARNRSVTCSGGVKPSLASRMETFGYQSAQSCPARLAQSAKSGGSCASTTIFASTTPAALVAGRSKPGVGFSSPRAPETAAGMR
ncbi:MAG: hypothetical protein RL514_290 [Verrucomicrobiota bacterium]|jgi:hypothetical protein